MDWVPVWTAAPTDAVAILLPSGSVLRQFITPRAAGKVVRLHFSNRLGTQDIELANVTLGRAAEGASLQTGSGRALSFGGAPGLRLAAGESAYSDPLDFEVRSAEKLALSLSLGAATQQLPRHFQALERVYLAPAGADASDDTGSRFVELPLDSFSSWFLVSALEVSGGPAQQVVVALGDSITDGYIPAVPCAGIATDPAIFGQNPRYPDFLARRLLTAGRNDLSVVNAGISGNRVTAEGFAPEYGPGLLSRIGPDVLALPAVRTVILQEGINDLGLGMPPDAAGLIAGLDTAVRLLQSAGLRVVLGTLTPARGFCMGPLGEQPLVPGVLSGTAAVDAARMQVNDWIRNHSPADAVADFDACLRDPDRPSYLAAAYDSGDNLHPNAAGYAALADCVDLGTL